MRYLLTALCGMFPLAAAAAETASAPLDMTQTTVGIIALIVFALAYVLVVMEEWLHLRKSIPVLLGAVIIWAMIGATYAQMGNTEIVGETVRHSLVEYAELFLFLLVAMTYINTLDERGVFNALRGWLVSRGFSLRTLFWLTGLIAFFLSPVADNMTTALVMASVAIAVGSGHPKFVTVACINIVVAANAGGAWSPFGDITTLMVWQKGVFPAHEFLVLFFPSLISWLIPAVIMSTQVPKATPEPLAVRPVFKNLGIGRQLVRIAVDAALHAGSEGVVLVGDLPYYGPLGFEPVKARLLFPGPVDPARVLIAAGGTVAHERLNGKIDWREQAAQIRSEAV